MNAIIFQDINDQYAYGKYIDFTVIIMKSNGYVNATKLCDGTNKRFRHWLENTKTKEYIEYYSKKTPAGKAATPIMVINNGDQLSSGTYLCKELIPALCQWISVEFYDRVQQIINEYAINEFKKSIENKDRIISEKSNKFVPDPYDKRKTHVFYITREGDNEYVAHRVQRAKFKMYNNVIISFETPNAVNMGVRLREKLGYSYNRFILRNSMTEQDLINVCREVNEEKYE